MSLSDSARGERSGKVRLPRRIAFIFAMPALKRIGIQLAGNMVLAFVLDEEAGLLAIWNTLSFRAESLSKRAFSMLRWRRRDSREVETICSTSPAMGIAGIGASRTAVARHDTGQTSGKSLASMRAALDLTLACPNGVIVIVGAKPRFLHLLFHLLLELVKLPLRGEAHLRQKGLEQLAEDQDVLDITLMCLCSG